MIIRLLEVRYYRPFTGARRAAIRIAVGKFHLEASVGLKDQLIGEELDLPQMVFVQEGRDIEVEAIAYYLHRNLIFHTEVIKVMKVWIELSKSSSIIEKFLLASLKKLCYSLVGLLGADLPADKLLINPLPITIGKGIQQLMTYIFKAYRPIEIAKD